MGLHPRTIATLDELRSAAWFSSVGAQDTDAAIVLSSWDEAIESCSEPEWENLLLEATNRYRSQLEARSPGQLASWNERVQQAKQVTVPLVELKTRDVVLAASLPRVFVDTVQWDILHVCMEAEYADVFPPGFFASQAFWYVRGHFPCGWQGAFPAGKLVIY